MLTTEDKDPSETITYLFDFTTLLAPTETISTATSTVSYIRGPITPSMDQLNAMLSGEPGIVGQAVTQELTGGFHGDFYTLEVEIVTSLSQTLVRAYCVPVQEF